MIAYRLLVARNDAALQALAQQKGWTILPETVRSFDHLDNDDDRNFKNIGIIDTYGPGLLALARPSR